MCKNDFLKWRPSVLKNDFLKWRTSELVHIHWDMHTCLFMLLFLFLTPFSRSLLAPFLLPSCSLRRYFSETMQYDREGNKGVKKKDPVR